MTYYVVMTDKFMSGWGRAQGKINKLVIICETRAEAQTVYYNAKDRPEMKFVNIRITKPYYNKDIILTSWGDKTDHSTWFRTDSPFRHHREG